MEYFTAFEKREDLITQYGKNAAFVVWGMGLYLDDSDLQTLADESLTDCGDDKKIDFLRFDSETGLLYVVQGYMAANPGDAAKANKASDLNTAMAWLFDGDINGFALGMRSQVQEVRDALSRDEIDQIELIYLHNCGESKACDDELKTAALSLKSKFLGSSIDVTYKEIGNKTLERFYLRQAVNMLVNDEIECPFKPKYAEKDGDWNSVILTVNGEWLRTVYSQYGDSIFSANYRGFLGLNRKKINKGIRNTAENAPQNFWVFNNGITILTSEIQDKGDHIVLSGMSIINGAQTTGAIGSLPSSIDLSGVNVLTRIVQSTSSQLIGDIVKYNNTQNKITSWDSFGNDEQQKEIQRQFELLHYNYNFKRGFDSNTAVLSIDSCIQPLLSFHGKYKDANRGKTSIFELRTLYSDAFDNVTARHILFVNCVHSAIAEIKAENKASDRTSSTDKRVYELLAPIKARHYVMAIISELLTKLNGNLSNKKGISFTPNVANGHTNNYAQLVSKIKPFISMVVGQIANYDIPNEVISHYNDSDSVAAIAIEVEQKISALKSYSQDFTAMVNDFFNLICEG